MRSSKPFIWSTDAISQLWDYSVSWAISPAADVRRNALRCKTMALIQEDRIFDNNN